MAGRGLRAGVRSGSAMLVTATLLLAGVGCKSKSAANDENFTVGLNKYLTEHSDCLLVSGERFPFETTDVEKTRQMDSLVKATLLEKAEEMSIKASRYTPTKEGERYAPRFCYGHREVTSIDGSTPVAVGDGFKETTVTYHYVMKDVPVWAKTAEVEKAFPKMADSIEGRGTAQVKLAQTPVGWQVPD